MLSFLRRSITQPRNFNGGGSSTGNPTILLSLIRLRSQYIHSSSSSFVVNYLMNSCGLSENQAINSSNKIDFENSSRPDSVLNLLENYGFTKPTISKLIIKYPKILLFDHEKTLKPKLEFFNSIGFSGIELAKFLSSYPAILKTSLQDKLVPCCETLENIVGHCENKNVVTILKRHPYILTGKLYVENLKVNVDLLRDGLGIAQFDIEKFLVNQPTVLTINASKFEEIVQEIKGIMGCFDPSRAAFLRGIQGYTKLMNVYMKWGWSGEEVRNAFRIYPECFLKQSEMNVKSTMDFLVNQMGYDSRFIAKDPCVFTYSLEKRIIPRCLVIQILVSKGHIKEQIPLSLLFRKPDQYFLENFVRKYEVQVPELFEVYRTSLFNPKHLKR